MLFRSIKKFLQAGADPNNFENENLLGKRSPSHFIVKYGFDDVFNNENIRRKECENSFNFVYLPESDQSITVDNLYENKQNLNYFHVLFFLYFYY